MTDRLRRTDDLLSARLGLESVILQLETGTYFGANEVGARIWELLAESQTLRSLSDAIEREYEVPHDVCERDVAAFVRELIDARLVEVDAGAPHSPPSA